MTRGCATGSSTRATSSASVSRISVDETIFSKRPLASAAVMRDAGFDAEVGGDEHLLELFERVVVELLLGDEAGDAFGEARRGFGHARACRRVEPADACAGSARAGGGFRLGCACLTCPSGVCAVSLSACVRRIIGVPVGGARRASGVCAGERERVRGVEASLIGAALNNASSLVAHASTIPFKRRPSWLTKRSPMDRADRHCACRRALRRIAACGPCGRVSSRISMRWPFEAVEIARVGGLARCAQPDGALLDATRRSTCGMRAAGVPLRGENGKTCR